MDNPIPMVIDFSADGGAEAMHREDLLPLTFLGTQSIERASDIKFDTGTQTWGIWLADGNGGFLPPADKAKGFPTYEEARTVEVKWLERCRLVSRDPKSLGGELVLDIVLGFHTHSAQRYSLAA